MLRRTLRRLACLGVAIVTLAALIVIAVSWNHFYPRNATPVVGPKGGENRAFIENQSFGDLTFVLCVSDWPHTFTRPASLACVMYSEGSDSRVFWSADGSVLTVREGSNKASWNFTIAYDYDHHETLRYDSARISALLASRGGIGPEQTQYPDGKGDY